MRRDASSEGAAQDARSATGKLAAMNGLSKRSTPAHECGLQQIQQQMSVQIPSREELESAQSRREKWPWESLIHVDSCPGQERGTLSAVQRVEVMEVLERARGQNRDGDGEEASSRLAQS